RTLMQKPREIVGCVRQQLAAPKANEQIEVLTFDFLDGAFSGGVRECRMREPQRGCIATQLRETAEEARIRCARQQCRKQCVLLCACDIDVARVASSVRREKIGA